ncbi:crotonase/enoyl-CoA hydratase family protein [Prosthecomicrobium sp. N25]|uniref:crotonase/enoyl-CoA hydratase family protein n=1 Tax=Prosthecomicrobium sp. N25 TaxID=3129254 RepID=UPI003078A296
MRPTEPLQRQETGLLILEQSGPCLSIGINRPEKRNALNDATIAALDDAMSDLPDGVGAVVIHGIGEHFCAGLDLSELTERDATEGVLHSRFWHRAFEKIQFGRVPVVAALKGAVIGGGLELAAACHIRIAERSAFYALPEGQRGIFVGGGGSVRIPRLIGVARMADMMLTGRSYSAEEGYALGLSQYLVEDGAALPKALELAEQIARNAFMTNFAVVHALPRIAEADPAAGYITEALAAAVAQSDREAKARIRAFLEKKAAKVKRPD